jgi:hypothetical protein
MQAERGSADLNFNFTLKLSAAPGATTNYQRPKRLGPRQGTEKMKLWKVEIGKVENRETEI